jgi:hypothetical protein
VFIQTYASYLAKRYLQNDLYKKGMHHQQGV